MIAGSEEKPIYWANALFSEADRNYNRHCVDILRQAGYLVFLPQEANINVEVRPSSLDIFQIDTAAVMKSRLMIACLDQETIDSGVACELGIAYSLGIPVIGLYTDVRQHRRGPGRMYKNPYIIGAIESNGVIVNDFEELLKVIPCFLSCKKPSPHNNEFGDIVERHYEKISAMYSGFIIKMESWYKTPWNPKTLVDDLIKKEQPKQVLEIGCGTGEIGAYIVNNYSEISYRGYDTSRKMISIAQEKCQNERCSFTSDYQEIRSYSLSTPFDIAIALFTLHDHSDKRETLSLLAESIRSRGCILIIDLSIYDLPRLVRLLKVGLARPIIDLDPRIDPAWLVYAAGEIELKTEKCELFLPIINFPTADDIDEYMNMFGIYLGMDLPLGLRPHAREDCRNRIKKVWSNWDFPFTDQRVFVECILRK